MSATPLVSVIVPIYNVEKYVRKCLESLKNQTMKEVEIICIDDGSTDSSGRIADEYKTNPKFRIIHTENKGLSAARNRGIDEADADWIMFVDSDDWVDKDFCRVPYEAALKYNADLVCFKAYTISRLGRVRKHEEIDTPTGIVNEMVAHGYGGWSVWNKLYKRTLCSKIRFPEGHVHEDLATAHRFVNEAEMILLLHDHLYYHADRKGSICNTHIAVYKRDGFVFALERYNYLTDWGYPVGEIEWLPQKYAIGYLASTRPCQDVLYLRACDIVNRIRGIPKEFNAKQKVALVAWKIDIRLFYTLCRSIGRLR